MSQIYLQRRSTTNENIFTELNAERLLATAFGVDVCLENSNCNPMLHSIDCDLANANPRRRSLTYEILSLGQEEPSSMTHAD